MKEAASVGGLFHVQHQAPSCGGTLARDHHLVAEHGDGRQIARRGRLMRSEQRSAGDGEILFAAFAADCTEIIDRAHQMYSGIVHRILPASTRDYFLQPRY
jgi:hypothetical protein